VKRRLAVSFILAAALACSIATGAVANAAPAPIGATPAPTPSPNPTRTPGSPAQNHTLSPEGCGKAHGRMSWWVGRTDCDVMAGGAIVAIHPGNGRVKYSGTAVEKEIDYVDANWYNQGATAYRYLPQEDCANFASQALHSRGWKETPAWHPGTADWASSTHLRAWVMAHHGAKELMGVKSFSQVKVGDIAQFAWHTTNVRNHTAIVTRVAKLADGKWDVWVGEHTDPWEYRDVRTVLTKTHPGSTVFFLRL
jgi:hypothetical protein